MKNLLKNLKDIFFHRKESFVMEPVQGMLNVLPRTIHLVKEPHKNFKPFLVRNRVLKCSKGSLEGIHPPKWVLLQTVWGNISRSRFCIKYSQVLPDRTGELNKQNNWKPCK